MKEPTRLCESDEFPAALRGAFRALEQEAPSAETVMRVQRALQALPPASASAAVTTSVGATKLWLVTALIAGAAMFGVVMHGRRSAPRAEREATRSLDTLREAPVASSYASAAAREPEAVGVAVSRDGPPAREQVPGEVSTPSPAKGGDLEAPPRARARTSAVAKPSRPSVSAQRNAVAAARSAQVGEALTMSARVSVEAEREPGAPEAPASPAAPVAAPSALSGEAALLAHAKRLSAEDPAAALRQVETLAQRFPDGTFAQERELLAIQLHQRLGHAALAEQLIRAFRERFPNSVYRRALPP
jgi:hypothetical protein